MSTTTPRTDENSLNWDRANRPGCDADFARTLETELNAVNARIAAVNKAIANWKQAESLWGIKKAELTRQLAAANARIAELTESNAVLQSQVDNADINLEQVRMTQKGMWKSKLESAEARIAELEKTLNGRIGSLVNGKDPLLFAIEEYVAAEDALPDIFDEETYCLSDAVESLTRQLYESQAQLAESNASQDRVQKAAFDLVRIAEVQIEELSAQLASAREDGELLNWLEINHIEFAEELHRIGWSSPNDAQWEELKFFLRRIRHAIKSARGDRTSPPASAEPGPTATGWINPNEYVEVRLTERGRKHWTEFYAGYPTLQKEAELDTFKTQLWTLLEVFGPITQLGGFTYFDIRPINAALPPPPTQDGKEQ